ncbi:MAG TPA: CHAT domain-containing tetratricopeptide repeat protein [Allosphingosinicella sp.]|nr:CHAT domain-containing tetratricopeptide repeat protein [Allosphingosinicella sp.]
MKRLALLALVLVATAPSRAAEPRISLQDSFRLGSGGSAICSAESSSRDPALKDMFDRAYAIVCRDAAAPVGRLYALRGRGGEAGARLASLRQGRAQCSPAARAEVEALRGVDMMSCTLESGLAYRVYSVRRGDRLYAAEGLAGYDSALRIGLRTLVADRPVAGNVEVAVTEAGDPAAFARAQAGALDPARARDQAYRRNNSGYFADAAEFFEVLSVAEPAGTGRAEAIVNDAVQQSNLGYYGEADALFARAAEAGGGDMVVARMLRNYRAIDLLNRGSAADALAELDKPLPPSATLPAPDAATAIDARTAARVAAESPALRQLGGPGGMLLPEERAQILDAQALHLRGTLLRLAGRPEPASEALQKALAGLDSVRDGRVASTVWLRAQIYGEIASLAEARGDSAEAERRYRGAIALLEADYPGSAALLSARTRLAAYQARSGRTAEARRLYREVVQANMAGGSPSPTLHRTLAPYFALLEREGRDPAAVAEMFKASQLLVRPGVAQTQAVLARELSGGSDEASRLFRQSVDLGRSIERLRVEMARLAGAPEPDGARLAALGVELAALEVEQVATQAKLSDFPRYRVLSGGLMELAELQQALRPGEAYYKMIVVGGDAYAVLATPAAARAWKIGAPPAELEREVDALRATVAVEEDGQILTYPFDVELAFRLYGQLFGPGGEAMAEVTHLIFEPDGAMLRLPPNLLVTERSGVDAYLAKARRPGDDGFDFTAVRWLGRDRDISTAVSARAFRDVRRAAASRARRAYLGMGENAPPSGEALQRVAVRGLLGEGPVCGWPLGQWARPISAAELDAARKAIGAGGAEIVTGAAFSDSAIKARGDLAQYRILHFATHGLVTPPRPECPARPALMTSFAGGESDGLLSFGEIYDLRLDADLVILSACDTAGRASVAATREAGLRGGGDFALDGLVRAFVGAGSRSVIASHWPVPDDFDATNRLISGLFEAPPGTATATALRLAQDRLMSSPDTSHPYYWAGFAIIGDGAAPVISRR